jgi:molybdopterin molybdotransferase
MITVAEAEKIVLAQAKDYGAELIPFETALGRILAEDIRADRDLPPYNRVTMDGIAFSYSAFEKGIRSFQVKATQAAGDPPIETKNEYDCIEIMTGAALPDTTDTVVRYEDLQIQYEVATIVAEKVKKGQNIHKQGIDKKANEIIIPANRPIDAAAMGVAATVGKTMLSVKKLPTVLIISTGEELVEASDEPTPFQVRRSNNFSIKAVLAQHKLAAEMLHIPDDAEVAKDEIENALDKYDVLILSGGISMGKFDHIPQVLEDLGVIKLFHKVQQRPGKPFWFGKDNNGKIIFAFPGNPVSTFMCLHRYFIPWLRASLAVSKTKAPKSKAPKQMPCAMLNEDFTFVPPLQCFLQVKLSVNPQGQLLATPIEGNGSGDFVNLADTDAFMELPMEKSNFKKGEVYRIWPFKTII